IMLVSSSSYLFKNKSGVAAGTKYDTDVLDANLEGYHEVTPHTTLTFDEPFKEFLIPALTEKIRPRWPNHRKVRNPISPKARHVWGLLQAKPDIVRQTPSRWCDAEVWCQLRCRPRHL
ncbi:hypothetical protein AVEN_118956-1, partial [Araneus ventricosus]